ncbi:hypothetical protein LINGRAHAP2_LOCUS6763 [Linum grandiflorum]
MDIANECMQEALSREEEPPSQDTPLLQLMTRQEAAMVVQKKGRGNTSRNRSEKGQEDLWWPLLLFDEDSGERANWRGKPSCHICAVTARRQCGGCMPVPREA